MLLKKFRNATCADQPIEVVFTEVCDTLTAQDDRERQQSLAVAFQNNVLPTFLSDMATGTVPVENLPAVLTVCEHLMQNESIRDTFPQAVRSLSSTILHVPMRSILPLYVPVMFSPDGPKDGQGVSKRGNMPTCRSRIDPASH